MSARRAPSVARLPALLAVAAIVVGLVAADHAGHSTTPSIRASARPVSGPSVPPPDAISSTWYCAEGTSNPGGRADETIIVANLARRPLTATITVLTGTDHTPVSRQVHLDALAQRRVVVSSIVADPEPGVVVEVPGGSVAVEHELQRGNATTLGACARHSSPSWYFAAADTSRGAEDWLALFNPFGDDAIVDLTFLTPDGVQAPGPAQAIVVPRRSRISVAVHDLVLRQSPLAIQVRARTGRLIAEQSVRYDGSDGRLGIATALGAVGFASHWTIPTGVGDTGTTANVALANFENRGTTVNVSVTLDGAQTLPRQRVTVPSMGVVQVGLSQRIPPGTGFSVVVNGGRANAVVAQLAEQWAPPATVSGTAVTFGSTVSAARWAFAAGRVDDTGDAQLVALNVSRRSLTVELLAYTAGNLNSPSSALAQAVRPGKRVTFDLPQNGVGADQVLVLKADGPIVAGRALLSPNPGLSLGLPELG
ncbi:MAG TPA: DUF5719 family protein [Acidimicrobiia bacterium]|nr:DUF5719 family protein [Acidimicrobiia bacterium]